MKLIITILSLVAAPCTTVRAAGIRNVAGRAPPSDVGSLLDNVTKPNDVPSLSYDVAPHDAAVLDDVHATSLTSPPPQVCFCTPHGMKKAKDWGKNSCEELGCPDLTDPEACQNKYFQPKYPRRFCEYRPPQVCFCTPHGMKKAKDWGKKSCEELGCPNITDPEACQNKYFQPKYPRRFCEYLPATASPPLVPNQIAIEE
jgi:hypothetical protein